MAQDSTSISCHLTVRDIARSMAFCETIMGFKRKMILPGPGGRVMHGEMTHHGATIMFGPESVNHGMRSPASLGGTPVSLFVYVDDVDSVFQKAQEAGATIRSPINDQFFGCRTFVMFDPDGHQWMVAQQKQAMTPDEITEHAIERGINAEKAAEAASASPLTPEAKG